MKTEKVKSVTLEVVESKWTSEIEKQLENIALFIRGLEETDKYEIISKDGEDITNLMFAVRSEISKAGSKKRGKIKRMINKIVRKPSLFKLNRLLRYLCRMTDYGNIRVVYPKHDNIQMLRSDWKKKKELADVALAAYKKAKGNFYKEEEVL